MILGRSARFALTVSACAGLVLTASCQDEPSRAGGAATASAAPTASDGATPPSGTPRAVWFTYSSSGVAMARATLGAARAAKVPGLGVQSVAFTVSPDAATRTSVATTGTGKGVLRAGPLGGRGAVVANDVSPSPCARPAWLDATRLVYPVLDQDASGDSSGAQKLNAVRLKGGTATRLPAIGRSEYACGLMASGDGKHLVGGDGQGGAGVVDTATGASRAIPGVGSFRHPPYVADVRGVSRDGRVAAVRVSENGDTPGDGSRAPFARPPALLDTRTGKRMPIPVAGKLIDATYLSGGGLLVRVAGKPANTLVLLVGGKEVKRWTEPAKMRTWGLLAAG